MKSYKLNHFDYFFLAVAAGVAACALLILVLAYKNEIDMVAEQILNR